MRQADRAGICAPPPELRGLVAALPYSAEEIGGAFEIPALPDGWIAELVDEGLVDADPAGPRLTKKGRDFSQLLDEYGSLGHVWRSRLRGEHGDYSYGRSRPG